MNELICFIKQAGLYLLKNKFTTNKFAVGSSNDQYPLSISGFDPFYTHPLNGIKFSSRDRDNGIYSDNCALH